MPFRRAAPRMWGQKTADGTPCFVVQTRIAAECRNALEGQIDPLGPEEVQVRTSYRACEAQISHPLRFTSKGLLIQPRVEDDLLDKIVGGGLLLRYVRQDPL